MTPAQKAIAQAMTEQDLLKAVEGLAHFYGWRTYHTWNSQHSAAGFPDLVLVRHRLVIFAELKSARGRLTRVQREWAALINGLPQEVVLYRLWRPEDLVVGTIDRNLRGDG